MRVFLVYSAAFHDGYKEKLLFLPFGFTSRDYRGSVYTKRRSVCKRSAFLLLILQLSLLNNLKNSFVA